MLEDTPGDEPTTETTDNAQAPAAEPAAEGPPETSGEVPAHGASDNPAPVAKTTTRTRKAPARKTAAKKAAKPAEAAESAPEPEASSPTESAPEAEPETAKPVKKAAARRRTPKKAAPAEAAESAEAVAAAPADAAETATPPAEAGTTPEPAADEQPAAPTGAAPLFQKPDASLAPPRKSRARKRPAASTDEAAEPATEDETPATEAAADEAPVTEAPATQDEGEEGGEGAARRRRRRGGRRRRKSGGGGGNGAEGGSDQDSADTGDSGQDEAGDRSAGAAPDDAEDKEAGEGSSSRRRRRRRRSGDDGGDTDDDPQNTVTKVRQGRSAEDQITSVTGSTRLEAKKQRRREGREAGRRRAPIVSEAEFLARRESVDRLMAIRQRDDLTQIAVLEDKVLVEHYVARESQTSLIGNVYLGRVQNVLPSMEAAFVDIGKGRNAVLYAGEVNWSALGHQDGQPRKIESVLSSGQSVLVQVTKDPAGHKGARLTSQISLAGRFLVYVPDGTNSGISRKLPDTERNRLKALLKEIVPDGAGVIVRTAAEGASEEELTRDVERLRARWEDIEKKAKGSAPQLLYGEPDLTLKVVRDLFTEDFSKLVVQGADAWETVSSYVSHVAPDLEERLERYDGEGADLFAAYRIDEQIAKGLDRKVWLPSGGSLVIDRTEAMTVVDVNTGKFTGSGGNLEETVTKNNLEAAEEIVRQLRLRDIGGIIVIDFIDMVLESNRDLVLRRLVECLGRDRTRHQVAEVTSLGLVQMTRKRIGTGLLEAFSETCTACGGRGLLLTETPVEPRTSEEEPRRSRRSRGGKGKGSDQPARQEPVATKPTPPSPKDIAAMARAAESRPDEPEEVAEGAAELPEEAAVAAEAAVPEPSAHAAGPTPTAEPAPAPETPEQPEAPAQPEAPEQPQAAPGTTTVVTRTRRRSARRPAGPPPTTSAPTHPAPVAVGSVGAPPEHGAVEPGTADSEPPPAPVVEHVPIKKRGSRKR